jgi:hypothetical protein
MVVVVVKLHNSCTFASPCLSRKPKARVVTCSSNAKLKARPLSVIPWELGKLLFNLGKDHLISYCFQFILVFISLYPSPVVQICSDERGRRVSNIFHL